MNTTKAKRIFLCLLSAAILAAALCSCNKNTANGDEKVDRDEQSNDNSIGDGENAENGENGENDGYSTGDPELDALIKDALLNKDDSGLPQGMTEIWFDDLFKAFYPKQLDDVFPTQVYVYGDLQTTQPIMCFCSDTLYSVELSNFENGTVGETVYSIEKLEPMESLVLQTELSEQPTLAISFKDSENNEYSYSLSRNADGSEVIAESLIG